MFVGVVARRYQHHTTQCCAVLIMKCYNSHKHSQSPLTNVLYVLVKDLTLEAGPVGVISL